MGHWGTAILSNDTSADIKDLFFNLFDKGKTQPEIRKEIETQFLEGNDIAENTDFWLTLALLQWQIGQLDHDVKEIAEKIVDQNISIRVWRESDADEKSLQKRKIELIKLKVKLQNPNPKPRKIRNKIAPESILPKGSVFAFPLKNGNYSAVIILEEILNADYYFALILNTDVNKPEVPTLEDVLKSKVLTKPLNQNESTVKPAISSYTNSKHKEIIKTFIKLGEVVVKENYEKKFISYGAAPWSFLIQWANMYLVDNVPRAKASFQLSDYIKISKSWITDLWKK